LIFGPNTIDHLFAAGNVRRGSQYVMALHRSLDGGNTWSTSTYGSIAGSLPAGDTASSSYGYAVAVHPGNENIIYLGGVMNYRGILLKSLNGGAAWTKLGGPVLSNCWDTIYDIAIDPKSSNRVYIGAGWGGLCLSEDSGSTWKKTLDENVRCIKINPFTPNQVWAGGGSGVYFSNNSGATWTEWNKGLTVPNVYCLDLNTKNKYIYAGTDGGGVYRNKY
jgi:photosystem II stability/assembly factor-like uncharacterized protein